MIIVIKDKDTAYVAASIECTYTAMHTDDIINEENLKMWHPHGKDNCIIAILFQELLICYCLTSFATATDKWENVVTNHLYSLTIDCIIITYAKGTKSFVCHIT